VGGHAGGTDHHFQAAFAGGLGILGDALGVAVGASYFDLVLYPEILEPGGALLKDRHV
jgi:hypothetical protein